MILEANRVYIIEKLDALNEAIDAIRQQDGGTETSKSARSVLVVRLEKERDRLLSILPLMTAVT